MKCIDCWVERLSPTAAICQTQITFKSDWRTQSSLAKTDIEKGQTKDKVKELCSTCDSWF